MKKLNYFVKLWTLKTNYYYHKLPTYIEEKGEKKLEYQEVKPVYVWRKNIDWNGAETWDVCPVDFSKPENKEKSWAWSITVNKFIGKSYFFTRKEAEEIYNKLPKETREKYDEIKQLKRLSK